MKKTRMIISLCLSLVLTSAVFAGCNKTSTKSGEDKNPGDVSTTVNGTQGNKLPLTDKPVTLKYWRTMPTQGAQVMTSLNDSLTYQELEKRTGVKIEFIHATEAQSAEQFNLMIAANDLPDIIQGAGQYKGGGEKAVSDGAYIKLNDLMEKYAPNYTKLRKSNPDIARQTSGDSGLIWSFIPILKGENPAWSGPMIKEDWLKDVGLSDPATMDEWYNVLKAFKDKKGATAPLFFSKTGLEGNAVFLSAYGVAPGYYKVNDKIKFGPIEPQFKEYLTTMKKWYQDGLIDKDFPTRTFDAMKSMFTSDKTGAVNESIDTISALCDPLGIKIKAVPYPVLKNGDKVQFRAKDWWVNMADATAVTSACKNPELAVKWLDYAFGEEGSMLFNFGVEGQSYVMENGKPKFTDLVMKNKDVPVNAAIWKFKVHGAPQLRWGAYSNPATLANPKNMEVKEMWTKTGFDHMIPPITLTAEEGGKFSSIMNNVNTYRDEMIIKFILGAADLSKFDEYVNEIKKMGIDDAIKLQQAAYDRYLKR